MGCRFESPILGGTPNKRRLGLLRFYRQSSFTIVGRLLEVATQGQCWAEGVSLGRPLNNITTQQEREDRLP